MATLDSGNYAIGTPDVFFCNTATKLAGGTATLASANSDLSALLNSVAADGTAVTARRGYTLGNLPDCSIAPEYTTLDHFVSDRGSRKKDKTVITEKNLKLTLSFDEMNVKNIQRFLMAKQDGICSILMSEVAEEGSAILVFQTDIGKSFVLALPRVTLKASGELAFSGENWIKASLQMDVLALPSFAPGSTTFKNLLSPVDIAPTGIGAADLAPYGYIQSGEDFGTFYVTV